MAEDNEVDEATAWLKKFGVSLLGGFLGAWSGSSISFWANNGMSLHEDVQWALIGAGVGIAVGWRLGGKL